MVYPISLRSFLNLHLKWIKRFSATNANLFIFSIDTSLSIFYTLKKQNTSALHLEQYADESRTTISGN